MDVDISRICIGYPQGRIPKYPSPYPTAPRTPVLPGLPGILPYGRKIQHYRVGTRWCPRTETLDW